LLYFFEITFIHTFNQLKISSKQFVHFQLSFKSSFMLHVHPNISSFLKVSSMYIWFSSSIIVIELFPSIHFKLSSFSTKQFVCLQLSSKKIIDVQLSSKNFIHFVTFIHVHVKKYFPDHSYIKDILKIFCPRHQNIPKISNPTHRLILMLAWSQYWVWKEVKD